MLLSDIASASVMCYPRGRGESQGSLGGEEGIFRSLPSSQATAVLFLSHDDLLGRRLLILHLLRWTTILPTVLPTVLSLRGSVVLALRRAVAVQNSQSKNLEFSGCDPKCRETVCISPLRWVLRLPVIVLVRHLEHNRRGSRSKDERE